jgi:plasmid maintenance system killer protein
VEISFVDVELARSCNEDVARELRYGPLLASVLRRRLGEIAAAEHLAALRRLPAARLRTHPADRCLLLIALGTAADLHATPHEDPPPLLDDGALHESAVRSLMITAVQPASAA